MRDSGGHSGNSYAEIHVPLLIIGDSDCRTNNETFYKQIDFATTFSLVNGLPVPTDSIGSIIPEMLAGLKPTERLAKLEIANKRLLTMIGREYKEGMLGLITIHIPTIFRNRCYLQVPIISMNGPKSFTNFFRGIIMTKMPIKRRRRII